MLIFLSFIYITFFIFIINSRKKKISQYAKFNEICILFYKPYYNKMTK